MPDTYAKTFEQLEAVASKFWPPELSKIESESSIIPLLLDTQEQFINIIGLETLSLEKLFTVIESASMPPNLFVKHLVILADFSGEMLKRVSTEFRNLFPDGELHYIWRGERQTYRFSVLPNHGLDNKSLRIDGKGLFQRYPLDERMKDAIALLLFGSGHVAEDGKAASALAKCEIGGYLGKPEAIAKFVKQRYIWVSQITGGAKANSLGQIAQNYVADYVKLNLDSDKITVNKSGRLPDVSHNDSITGLMTSFDIVVTDDTKYVAIEVSFQVTTNSVIERKAGQAQARYEQIEKAGHKIAYVLDGAGNFERETALRTICSFSHCTVAFSDSELDLLCKFLKEQFGSSRSHVIDTSSLFEF